MEVTAINYQPKDILREENRQKKIHRCVIHTQK